jgi:hypothetical protein
MIATAKLQILSSKFTKEENGENPNIVNQRKRRRGGGGERKRERERERERAKAEEALHLLHRQIPLASL